MKNRIKIPYIYDILLTLIGVSMCGIGAGFANCAMLGMDSIGIFYDGIRNILGLGPEALGIASFIVNGIIIVILLVTAKKYVSIGTIIHVIAYGSFVTVGTIIYNAIVTDGLLYVRIIFCVVGFLVLYTGISLFVAVDIGVDAFTGIVLFLSDLTHIELKYVKIVFDIILVIAGFILGGTLGVATFVTMVFAGPFIQFLSKRFQAKYFRLRLKHMKNDGAGSREAS